MFPAEIHAALRAMLERLPAFPGPERSPEGITVVLDTHVVMECFFWRDASAAPLREAIETGTVQPVVSEATMLELAGVLSRPQFGAGEADVIAVLEAWSAHVRLVPGERVAQAAEGITVRCRDPEDQKFLSLAAAAGARLLVTRDRVLTKAAKRLKSRGLVTVTPEGVPEALSS